MQKRNGFSRWEMLGLGAVVGVVGALLMPVVAQSENSNALERARDYARDTVCMSNLKQLSVSLLQYQQDFDERMPKASLAKTGSVEGPIGPYAYGWADAIWPYTKSREVFQCPSEKHTNQNTAMKPGYTDYWLNTNLSGAYANDIKLPAMSIMVGDGDGGASNSNARYNLNVLPKGWISEAKSPARRHHDAACYAFADGHVKKLAPSAIGTKAASFKIK